MIEGEPEYDMFAWDLARFGDWADKAFTKAQCVISTSTGSNPCQMKSAAPAGRTRPIYELQREMGAVFGLNTGWNTTMVPPMRSEPRTPTDAVELVRPVGRGHVFDSVGVIDISGNYVVSELVPSWLEKLVANHVPTSLVNLPDAADWCARRCGWGFHHHQDR